MLSKQTYEGKKREFEERWEKEEEKCTHSFPFLARSNSKIITLEASKLNNLTN
jgi:hypothetical protein